MSPYHREKFAAAVATLKAKHPECPEAFQGENLAALQEQYELGAARERKRIQGIDAFVQARGGVDADCRQLVELMRFDGVSTAGDVAQAIGLPNHLGAGADEQTVASAAGDLWDRVPAVRGEFTTKESFVAYKVAETCGRFKRQAARGLYRATAADFKGS